MISSSVCLLLVYKEVTGFHKSILNPATVLRLLIALRSFLLELPGSHYVI